MSIMSFSAFAAESQQRVTDLGDGFYVVETITQYAASRRGNTVSGRNTGNVYYNSTLIGTATLSASFDISGSTARAEDAYITGTGKNGGTYSRGTTRLSGNTAYGTAYFRYNGDERSMTISLSCSPGGALS